MAVINLIIETMTELSTTYITSTLPKPIKKLLYKIQINKLKKIINKIPEDKITYETLSELCIDIFNRHYSYIDNAAKFENMIITIDNYMDNPPLINNQNEYTIKINISETSYARLILQLSNEYNSNKSFKLILIVKTEDKILNKPIIFSSRSFDKYQEISIDIIDEIFKTEKLTLHAVESYKLVLQILCNNLKKYLNSYIGIYDKINL